ncbi:MAG: hypothetical protein HYU48_01250 [Candidatus Levybacteria bacterium]|nr:hypothetical protein [Candidatus Levybacteria bacterium]
MAPTEYMFYRELPKELIDSGGFVHVQPDRDAAVMIVEAGEKQAIKVPYRAGESLVQEITIECSQDDRETTVNYKERTGDSVTDRKKVLEDQTGWFVVPAYNEIELSVLVRHRAL